MKRRFGVLMPVFALGSEQGIGDFGPAAYKFINLLARSGASYWQILPLNGGNPENGESPYFSVSAFAINPLLISLERLQDQGLLRPGEVARLPHLPADHIAYAAVRRTKWPLLRKAAVRFTDTTAYERFCSLQRAWLEDFALFDVLRSVKGHDWPSWPSPLRKRDRAALAEFAASQAGEIRIRKVLQFLAMTQWQDLHRYCTKKNIAVIGDMPIYVARDGAETWSRPGLFKLDAAFRPRAVSGVPPDFFSATGQLWNNPVYNWNVHRRQGFAWWIERLRHLFLLYDSVRIDHFRGLVQYWEVPFGAKNAMHGAWRNVPTYKFFDTLISEFESFPVVCEDLGIITPDVKAAMAHYGFPGMKVLQFAFGDNDPHNSHLPRNYTSNCFVYLGTHDNLPTLGWLARMQDNVQRLRIARATGRVSDDRQTVWDLIELAFKSKARVAIVTLQDVLTLGAEARINNPATGRNNWRWRWVPATASASRAFARLRRLAKKYKRIIF